jgi:conjugal transfer pilus assembly protein TraD
VIPFQKRLRVLLAVESCLLFIPGAYVALFWRDLPYGASWPFWLVSGVFGALLPAAYFLRCQVLAKRLRTPRQLRLEVDRLRQKMDHTYLGEGFVWGPAQTRLLQELSANGVELPSDLQDGIGGDWLIHGIGGSRTGDLFLPDHMLNQHIFLMGAPGSGKTRGLEVLIEQAVRRGDAVVVIDPKGDEGLLDRTYDSAVRHGRRPQFRVLALPYPYQSSRYNPLQCIASPSDIADRICSIMPRRGDSEAFRNFAWQFVSIVANAIIAVGDHVSLVKLEKYCFHDPWFLVTSLISKLCPDLPQSEDLSTLLDAYRRYCSLKKVSFPVIDQLISMASMDREYFGKISGALKTVLAKLTSPSVGYLLCPEDVPLPKWLAGTEEPKTISWECVDQERLVVYLFLGSLIGPDSASATARMTLADLMSYVGRKYAFEDASGFSRQRLTVIVDEVADALAPESVNILNKARGAGLSMVMAGQSLADLEVALGSAADARRALANMGTFLTLRAANPDDARFFTDKVGVRPLRTVTRGENYEPALFATGRSTLTDFAYRSSTSTSMRNEHLLPTAVLDRLARFHFFGLWAGELRKGMLPLLDPPRHLYSPILKRDGHGPKLVAQESMSPTADGQEKARLTPAKAPEVRAP